MWHGFITMSASCACIAMVLVISILKNTTIDCIIKSIIPIIDLPDHKIGVLQKIKLYINSFLEYNMEEKYIVIVMVLLIIVVFIDNNIARKNLYFILSGIISIIYMYFILMNNMYINFLTMPIAYYGLMSYLLRKEKKQLDFFIGWLIPFIFSLAVHWSSNNHYYVISSAFSVAIIPSILSIYRYISSQNFSFRKSFFPILAVWVLFFGMWYSRYSQTYWDLDTKYLNTKILVGSNKGIYTNQFAVDNYSELYSKLGTLRRKQGKVLYFSKLTWLYLEDDKRMASYSAWLFNGDVDFTIDRLKQYYYLHPEMLPDWIYVDPSTETTAEYILTKLGLSGDIDTSIGDEIIRVIH